MFDVKPVVFPRNAGLPALYSGKITPFGKHLDSAIILLNLPVGKRIVCAVA